MAVESVQEQLQPDDWIEWFLVRLHQEPWALGGFVVVVVFVLGALSLVVFALLYGCCCSPAPQEDTLKKRMKEVQQQRKLKYGVI